MCILLYAALLIRWTGMYEKSCKCVFMRYSYFLRLHTHLHAQEESEEVCAKLSSFLGNEKNGL